MLELEDLAKVLRASRISHTEIAAKTNVGRNTVGRFLSGASTRLSVGVYQALRDYAIGMGLLKVSLLEFQSARFTPSATTLEPDAIPPSALAVSSPLTSLPSAAASNDVMRALGGCSAPVPAKSARYTQLIAWLDDEYSAIMGQRPAGEWAARRDLNAFKTYGSFHELSPLRRLKPADLDVLRAELPPPRGRARPVPLPFVRKLQD